MSRNLVMATGGKQKISQSFIKKYEVKKDCMVLTSDEVLHEKKFRQIV